MCYTYCWPEMQLVAPAFLAICPVSGYWTNEGAYMAQDYHVVVPAHLYEGALFWTMQMASDIKSVDLKEGTPPIAAA